MKKLLVTLIILCGAAVSAAPTLPWQKQPEPVKPDAITEQAKILYAQNEIDSALEILKGKADDDRNADDWLIMGNILQDKDKIDQAIYMYNQAITKAPLASEISRDCLPRRSRQACQRHAIMVNPTQPVSKTPVVWGNNKRSNSVS